MTHRENPTSINSRNARRMLAFSLILLVIFFVISGMAFYHGPATGKTLLAAFIVNALGGRAAGVGLCMAFDINIYLTIGYNMFLEVLIVCFSFAFFLYSFSNRYLRFRFLQKAIRNSQRNALRYEEKISRYGWIGIFAFVMIPLPVTGPVAGSFIAHFLGFSIKRNFIAVFSGTFVAIVLWSLFFEFLSDHLNKIQGVFAVAAIVVGVYFFKHIRNWFSKDGFGASR